MFDKHCKDVLSEHNQYDLAIEIENDQVSSFGPTYDYSKLELKVLCEYINDILEKKFIIPSKSPSEALVLFSKKVMGAYISM